MTRFPILLAHGIAPFDQLLDPHQLDAGDDAHDYFRKIPSTLRAAGYRVHRASVDFSGGVSKRATDLKAEVQRVLLAENATKLHIVAHSMGGLDARHLLFEHQADRMADKILSLTTIGTPHLGTSFADLGVHDAAALLQLLDTLGIRNLDGFADLTTLSCRAFNAIAENFERSCGVRFQTYAGKQNLPFIFAPLQPAWLYIHAQEGDNDGLVSVASALWRDEYFCDLLDADHLNEIGWWDPNELGAQFFPARRVVEGSRSELEARIQRLYLDIAGGLARFEQ